MLQVTLGGEALQGFVSAAADDQGAARRLGCTLRRRAA